MSKHLNEIIRRLGYSESPNLKYRSNGYDAEALTAHTIKVLQELFPYAVYMVDGEPFVMFFDEPANQAEQRDISKRIWNAQIPVAIFCGTAIIRIFNGCTINKKTHLLTEAENISYKTIDEIDENTPFSFWEITSQTFWKKYTQQFSGKKLNNVLLDNLTYLTDRLKNTYKLPYATKLVLRLIFIRYLIDRGVDIDYLNFSSDVKASREALLALLDDKSALYSLFAHLKDKFNGNLFELGNENENTSLTEDAMKELKDFLSANIVSSGGQLSLFDLYDFNIIPVELISNIYEILLGKEAQNKDNAFYTPRYLVDYILDATVNEHIEENQTFKILDPSCGSGVFLVDSYRRMIEKKLKGASYTEDDMLLCSTLTDNIFGIDLNPDAIDVAIFSLYVAVLDYKNPKTLKRFHLPDLRENNLLVCDFFDEARLMSLKDVSFDFIIGNPPWSSNIGMHVDYCKKHGYEHYLQNNDTCRSFVLRSKDFRGENTQCCFVLHSTILYMQKKPSKKFREFLLTNTEILRVIELSSVRKLIFKNADAPAVILTYKFTDQNVTENRFEHISMKPNWFFRLFNIIVVEKNDVKSVQQKLLLENDWVWKTLVYGLSGDIDNIIRLKRNYPSIRYIIEEQSPKLLKGAGVKYNDGNQDASLLLDRPLLESNAVDHFAINTNMVTTFVKSRVDRRRDERLFHAPYCLVLTGIDTRHYTLRAAYSETDFVFKSALYAIKGKSEQKKILLNLTGLFNSTLYSYLNLLLGSSLGIEREQRLFDEVLNYPYIFSNDIVTQVEEIQKITNQNSEFMVSGNASNEIIVLNRIILEAFGLSNNEFVDYALRIQIPQLTGVNDGDANREVDEQDLEVYGKYFYDCLSAIFANAHKYIQIRVYPIVAKHYSAFEVVVIDSEPTEWLKVVNDKEDYQKAMFTKLSAHRTNELFYSLKNVLFFDETSFYIIKPSYYKNWHPAIAKLDLMEVTDQILSRKIGGEI